MQRPRTVSILAVLAAFGGIIGIYVSFALFAKAGDAGVAATGFLAGDFAVFWALGALVISSINLVFAYGAWYLKPWAWILGIGVEGLAVLVALINWIGGNSGFFNFLISAAIAGVIIYYLFTPEIKKVFGRV